jgi:N-acetylmuramoyl-L-alanine amidase
MRYLLKITFCFLLPLIASANTAIVGVRLSPFGEKIRFVVDVDGKPTYKTFALDNPPRLVLDVSRGIWAVPKASMIPKGVRHARHKTDVYRLVVEMNKPIQSINTSYLEGTPNRVIVDVTKVTSLDTSLGAHVSKRKPPVFDKPIVKKDIFIKGSKPIIVIDPGHGGKDPGATGVTGLHEKDLVLKMAQELKDILDDTRRYDVRLTRYNDRFIVLKDRVKIAQANKADLFISIHADAHTEAEAQGASVYTLSENASDAEAAMLAAKENKADLIGGIDLSGESLEVTSILVDLVQRETMNLSSRFASFLVDSLSKKITLKKNTHRFAGFAVLKAPDTASVLLELGFLSNSHEEWQLKQRSYRDKIARGIVHGIDNYFAWKKKK